MKNVARSKITTVTFEIRYTFERENSKEKMQRRPNRKVKAKKMKQKLSHSAV